jgi:hypothetical protein
MLLWRHTGDLRNDRHEGAFLTFCFAQRDRRFRLETTFITADLSDWLWVGVKLSNPGR